MTNTNQSEPASATDLEGVERPHSSLATWLLWGWALLVLACLAAVLIPWDDLALALNLRSLMRLDVGGVR